MRSLAYFLTGILFSLLFTGALGQELAYARRVIADLSSTAMHGRGYVKKGDKKAARYLAREFHRMDLQSFGKDYYQSFRMPVNTIPGLTVLRLDGHLLVPGREYVISSSSPGVNGTFTLQWIETDSSGTWKEYPDPECFTVINGDARKWSRMRPFHSAGIIIPGAKDEKLTWHISDGGKIAGQPLLSVRSGHLNEMTRRMELKYKTRFIPDYETRNVIGYIPGNAVPDSFIVITAHYDHLGCMGRKTCYPGANDNASGTAMMLDLAGHYANASPSRYTMVFIAFAAEEAGLLGSGYFAEHPLFPLDRIRFLINLDLVGTGSEGITVVNGSVYDDFFNLLRELNDRGAYVPEIKARGEACNSDHCPFHEKGVPAFFIYTRGEEFIEYHNLYDRAEDLPLTSYSGLFRLIIDFCNTLIP